MRTEYRREDNDDTRCQQNLGKWKVGWRVVADGEDQRRLVTEGQLETSRVVPLTNRRAQKLEVPATSEGRAGWG